MKTKPLKGYAARRPDGTLRPSVYVEKSEARTDAAFAFMPTHGIRFPDDWYKARRAGWRVVPVVVKERSL